VEKKQSGTIQFSFTTEKSNWGSPQPGQSFPLAPVASFSGDFLSPNTALLEYKLYRSNCIWFASQSDGYSSGDEHDPDHSFYFPKGHSKSCSDYWLALSEEAWKLIPQDARAAVVSLGLSEATTPTTTINVSPANLPHANNCKCFDCLKLKLARGD
jgi:hypothetical protein